MKKKLISLTAALLAFILLLTGCAGTEKAPQLNIDDYFALSQNEDNTYSYTLKDKNGSVLLERTNEPQRPSTFLHNASVLGATAQNSATLSSKWAVFWDVENSQCSKIFFYYLGAKDARVVYAEYCAGEHFIIVEDMFDADTYYSKYKIKNVSNVLDFAVGCRFDDAGHAIVTYLSGENHMQTEFIIDLT